MSRYERLVQGVVFLLAAVVVLGLVACGEAPGVPRGGQQAGQPAQALQPGQQQAQPAAPASAESAPSSAEGGEGGGALAQRLQELEGVKAEDVPLTTGTVEVELKDFEFAPNVFHAKAGDVTFVFNNTATHAHNYRITGWNDHENVVYPGPKIGARKKRKVTIDLEPGVYYVFCNLSDHEERGMVGKLFVEP